MTPSQRIALRWLPTFLGFPLGGVAAELVVGPIDGLVPALLGGAITGLVLGAVQSWGFGWTGRRAYGWIAATAAGVSAGLALGSALVGYDTTLGDLVLQSAICGLAVATAQTILLRRELGRLAYLWAPALSVLWGIGWAITTSIGVDVESQDSIFGSSGALVVTAATAILPVLLAQRSTA